ncbi:hypothetical protein LEMLEM_LOCUS17898 [Lemmus lemmus]
MVVTHICSIERGIPHHWIALETPRCWRCQSCMMSPEESCKQGVEPAQERKVYCSQQS